MIHLGILDFQQYQSNLTNPGSSEQLKTEAQFLLKKVFNGIKVKRSIFVTDFFVKG